MPVIALTISCAPVAFACPVASAQDPVLSPPFDDGSFSSATERGTLRDFAEKENVVVKAGKKYVAKRKR